jgi:hypothetical protein
MLNKVVDSMLSYLIQNIGSIAGRDLAHVREYSTVVEECVIKILVAYLLPRKTP